MLNFTLETERLKNELPTLTREDLEKRIIMAFATLITADAMIVNGLADMAALASVIRSAEKDLKGIEFIDV
jgi:hypothetical protein